MKISTRLRLAVYIPIFIAIIIGITLVLSYQETAKIQKTGDTVRQIRSSITELNHNFFSYTLSHEEGTKLQFLTEHEKLTGLIAGTQLSNPDQQHLLDGIRQNNEIMQGLFLQIVYAYEDGDPAGVEDQLAGLLLAKSYQADTDASRLRTIVDDGIRVNETRTIWLIFLVMLLVTIPLTVLLVRIRYTITSSLSKLNKGAAIIGSGDLDFRIEEKGNDEITDLSRAFNRMSANLKSITTSKSDLEREAEERKKAEAVLLESKEKLKNSEVRYRRLFETAQDAILILNGDTGQIIDANPFIKDLLGYSLEELQGKNLWEIGELKDMLASKISVQQLHDEGYIRYEHLPLVTRDGRSIGVEVVANAYKVDNIKIIQCNIRDVTERKRAEEALKLAVLRRENLLRILQYEGRNVREFVDYSLEEALKLTNSKIGYIYFYDEGKREFTLSSWSKEVMTECAIASPPTIYQLDKTGIWGEVVRQRKPIIVNDFQSPNPQKKGYPEGHSKLLRWMSLPVFSHGKIVAVVGVANKEKEYDQDDINQLDMLMSSVWTFAETRKMEETVQFERNKLTAILNSMEDGVCIMDRDHNLEYINPSLQSQFGNIDGKKCYQYFSDLEDVCPWCNNEEVFHGKTLRRETPITRSGAIFEITDTPLRNFDGTVSKLALFHDITEHKKLDQLKDDFIGMVSHELRTPLTIVTGAIHTAMLAGLPPEELPVLLQEAARGTKSLADILENLIELSRHQSMRLLLNIEPLYIKEVIDHAIEHLSDKSPVHRLVADVPDQLPTVEADRVRVERILYNLIENAIKYSPRGGEVRIFARMNDDSVIIGVSDQGIGISSEDRARLFQPFQRLGESAHGVKGLGLGLIVCLRLAEAHQGRLWVESEPGKGSTFYFTLPGKKGGNS